MSTRELVLELLSKSNSEIREALLVLMLEGKLDFVDLNQAYVKYLNFSKERTNDKLIEAETCVMLNLMDKKDNNTKQRSLYLLNQSNRFNMEEMNKKLGYDEEIGKSLSIL